MSSQPDNAGSPDRRSDLVKGLSGPAIFLIVFGAVSVLSVAGWLLYLFFQQQVQGGNPDPARIDGGDDDGGAAVAGELELVSTGERSFGEVLGSGVSSDCSICLETFVGTDFPGCQHVFHRACIVDWVGPGPLSCPLCRRTVEVAVAAT